MSLSIAGIVLAGGLSRRMGGLNKANQTLGNKTLLAHSIEHLEQQVQAIAINANDDNIHAGDWPIIKDSMGGFRGPLAGVLTGLEWAQTHGHSHIVTVATDTPFFPSDLLERFLKTNDGNDKRIILAGSGGYRHPVFGLWPVTIASDLKHWLETSDTNKVLAFVQKHDWAMAEFDFLKWNEETFDPFFNINTPDDLERAEKLLRARPS